MPGGIDRKRSLPALAASIFLFAGLVAFTGLAGDSQQARAATSPAEEQLGQELAGIVGAEGGPPGVAVLLQRNGQNRFISRGVANVATGAKPSPNQRLRTASVSKAFNGAIILRLASQGKLRLNDRLGKWVPNLLPKARRATVGQLLHHTAGLPEYIKTKAFVSLLVANPHRYMTPRKMVSFVRNLPLTHRPGAKYRYSDTDNIVAGIIAKRVSGASYGRLLKQAGRQVGGLPGTSLPLTAKMPNPALRGYELVPNGPPEDVTTMMNPALAWASGGIVSTMSDLGRFFRAYVRGRIFRASVVRAQRHWVPGESGPAGPGVNSAGMALFRYRTRCGTVYGHTGNYPGYRVFSAATADGKRSVVWVANAQITSQTNSPNSRQISALMRRSQVTAVCALLR